MLAQFTKDECRVAFVLLLVLAAAGLAMAFTGRDDLLGMHGGVVMLAALAGIFAVTSQYYSPEPTEEQHRQYYDDPTKAGIIVAMGWAVFGLPQFAQGRGE